MLVHSIRTRFAFTVIASLFRGLLGFITGMLLARWMGPDVYGDMAFLLGTFLGIRQLMDMGSSSAFFTFMSQRPRSKRFVLSYFAWLALQGLIGMCVIGLIFPDRWISVIWHGENRGLVLLAFLAAFMQNSVWTVVQQTGESQRLTVRVQSAGVAVVGAHLLAVILLWRLGILGLYAIFVAIAIEYFLATIVLLGGHTIPPIGESDTADGSPEPQFREYLRYCLPLISYSIIGFAYAFFDKWLLQRHGGSVEQAYYAVGAQFGAVALLATSSILRIFWKEVAEAHHRGDHTRTENIYMKVSRLLFHIGAIIAGFLIPWTRDLLGLILGTAYVGGTATTAIMFLYPVHQSMGQIVTTMFLATERVSIQVFIGSAFMIAGMAVTYLVLAPRNSLVPGLELGSEGLAIKMVVLQVLQVNLLAYILARISKWRFDWLHQFVSLICCLAIGWLSHFLVISLAGHSRPLLMTILVGGALYLGSMGMLVYTMPWLTGLTRNEFISVVGRLQDPDSAT